MIYYLVFGLKPCNLWYRAKNKEQRAKNKETVFSIQDIWIFGYSDCWTSEYQNVRMLEYQNLLTKPLINNQ